MASLISLNKGGCMRSDSVKATDAGKTAIPQKEIDSAPKTYTPSEQILSGLKVAAIAGIILVLLWLFDKIKLY